MNNIEMSTVIHNSTIDSFESVGYVTANINHLFPQPTGKRIMMMPFFVQDIDGSLPDALDAYKPMLHEIMKHTPKHVEYYDGNTAYLTIDEMMLEPNVIQRKPGLHVDGMYNGELAGAWGGGGGGWGSCGNGMFLVSNTNNLCKMWTGRFKGRPIGDGDCEGLRDQLAQMQEYAFQAGDLIWADGLLVHESYPATQPVFRQFLRLSLPNNAPWFKGYSENPLGIKACGEIMDKPRITTQTVY